MYKCATFAVCGIYEQVYLYQCCVMWTWSLLVLIGASDGFANESLESLNLLVVVVLLLILLIIIVYLLITII